MAGDDGGGALGGDADVATGAGVDQQVGAVVAVILAAARLELNGVEQASLPERRVEGLAGAGGATRGAVWAMTKVDAVGHSQRVAGLGAGVNSAFAAVLYCVAPRSTEKS